MVDDKNLKKKNMDLDKFIEFNLGLEDYAIPLVMVKEVISFPKTTPIPNSPNHFLGIMNLRGQVISIVDLRVILKLKAKEDNEKAVIILDIDGLNIGVVVDSINSVLAFSTEDISEVPFGEVQLNTNYISGVYRKKQSLTILLNIAKALNLKEIESIDGSKKAA